MGTRFVATTEAPVHDRIKQALVAARETDTRLMFRTLRNSARVLANATSEEVLRLERREGGAGFRNCARWSPARTAVRRCSRGRWTTAWSGRGRWSG